MNRWLSRHSSMRGRLALLLIVFLVLPLLALGLWDYGRALDAEQAVREGSQDTAHVLALELRSSEVAVVLRDALDAELARFALAVSQLRSHRPEDVQAGLSGSREGRLPTRVAEFPPVAADPEARWLATVSEGIASARRGHAGGVLAGHLVLPGSFGAGGPGHLHQIVVVRLTSGALVVAARDLHGGEADRSLLDGLAAGNLEERALLLPDGSVTLRRSAPASRPARDGDEDLLAQLAESRQAWVAAGPDPESGTPGLFRHRGTRAVVATAALTGLEDEVVALVGVQVPLHGPLSAVDGAATSRSLRGLLGRLAVLGMLLAIGIGLLAPRFVWRDIRDSTDFIFHSVERLRELVGRISLALSEQQRVIGGLSTSVAVLETDSSSIADTSRSLAHSASQSAWVSQSGNLKAELAQRAMVDMRSSVTEIREQMAELDRRCTEIGVKLQSIADLSAETNKVSINASIELRGAGSTGQHFGEFVEEIRQLADQALSCTRDIRQVVEEIQAASRMTVEATDQGVREVDKCQGSFEELETSFARILRWVEDTTQSAQGIQRSTARQTDSLQSVAGAITSLDRRAQETVGHFDAVVDASDELADLARRMNETWKVG